MAWTPLVLKVWEYPNGIWKLKKRPVTPYYHCFNFQNYAELLFSDEVRNIVKEQEENSMELYHFGTVRKSMYASLDNVYISRISLGATPLQCSFD